MNMFLDADEAILNSVPCSQTGFTSARNAFPHYEAVDIGYYCTFIRPFAHQLIELCREIAGENVYILTHATQDYIEEIVRKANFDIPFNRIYAREDIKYVNGRGQRMFQGEKNLLIDNLPYSDHLEGPYSKVRFLDDLRPEDYIQVKDFIVFSGEEDSAGIFEDLKGKIEKWAK